MTDKSHRLVRTSAPERPELDWLIEAARGVEMTPEMRSEQRRSFARGQMMMSHPEMAVEEVDRLIDEALKRESTITDTPKVEAVARAIRACLDEYKEREGPFGLYDYSSYPGDAPPYAVRDFRTAWTGSIVSRHWRLAEAEAECSRLTYEHFARAAIAAMKEPTPAMLEAVGPIEGYAGDDIYDPMSTIMQNADRNHVTWWNAMIDAALTEATEGE